jgi:hypothetical protein
MVLLLVFPDGETVKNHTRAPRFALDGVAVTEKARAVLVLIAAYKFHLRLAHHGHALVGLA